MKRCSLSGVRSYALLNDRLPPQHRRSLDEIGVDVAAFLSEKYQHFAASRRDLHLRGDIAAWIKDAYDALLRLEHEPDNQEAYDRLDRIRSEFDAACPVFAAAMFPELAARESGLREALQQQGQQRAAIQATLTLREADLEQARSEILTRDETIAQLQTTLTARDVRIAALNTREHELETEIASLSAALAAQGTLLADTEKELERKTEDFRAEVAQREDTIDELIRNVEALQRSTTFRTGRAVTAPARAVRLIFGASKQVLWGPISLKPLNHVELLSRKGRLKSWRATGDSPQIEIALPSGGPFVPGHYRLTVASTHRSWQPRAPSIHQFRTRLQCG